MKVLVVVFGVLFLSGCGSPPSEKVEIDPQAEAQVVAEQEASEPLDASLPPALDPEQALSGFPRRGIVEDLKRHRFSRDKPWIKVDVAVDPKEVAVIDEAGGLVRIAVERYGLRMLHYVERSALAPRLKEKTDLSWTPDGEGSQVCPGLSLLGGTKVVQGEVVGEAQALTYEGMTSKGSPLTIYGWASADVVDHVFEVGGFPPAEPPEQWIELRGAHEIFAPTGEVLAKIELESDYFPLIDLSEGCQMVEVVTNEARVCGCVDQDEPKITGSAEAAIYGTMVGSGGFGWGMSNPDWKTLKRGTLVYDAPGGEPFAVVVDEETDVHRMGSEGGWSTVYFPSHWGWPTGFTKDAVLMDE